MGTTHRLELLPAPNAAPLGFEDAVERRFAILDGVAVGAGAFKIPLHKAADASNYRNQLVDVLWDDLPVGTFAIRSATRHFDSGMLELEAVQVVQTLDARIVYPEQGPNSLGVDPRLFTFASNAYSLPFDGDPLWSLPVAATSTQALPDDWPGGGTRIWGPLYDTGPGASPDTPVGDAYFVHDVTIPADDNYVVAATADDEVDVWLAGAYLFGSRGRYQWRKTHKWEGFLPAGVYRWAIKGRNLAGAAINNAWVLGTVRRLDSNGDPTIAVASTGTGGLWRVYETNIDAPLPGFSVGEVLRQVLLDPARTLEGPALVRSFTDDLDTAGQPWQTEVEGVALPVPVGTTGVELLKLLADAGYGYFKLRHDRTTGQRVLDAWVQDPSPATAGPVVLEEGRQIVGGRASKDWSPAVDRLLVATDEGYVEYDRVGVGREALLSLGSADADTRDTVANAKLDELEDPAPTIDVRLAPGEAPLPFVDYQLGSFVDAPDHRGQATTMRVVGITVADGDTGAQAEVQLAALDRELIERHERMLRIAARGTLRGGALEARTFEKRKLAGTPGLDAAEPSGSSSPWGAWQALTLENGWVQYQPGSWPTPAARKSLGGVVQVKGMITGGSALSTVTTLPTELRPDRRLTVICAGRTSSTGTLGAARVDIHTDGRIVVGTSHATPSGTGWLALDGIVFAVDSDAP